MATTPIPAPQSTPLRRSTLALPGGLDTARVAALALLAVALLGVASLLYLNLAASVANSSTRLNDLTKQRRMLDWQKAAKEQELAQLTNPERLATRATELGFRPPRSVTYLSVPPEVLSQLADKTRPASATTGQPTAPPDGDNGIRAQFERWLRR